MLTEARLHAKRHRKELRRRGIRAKRRWARECRRRETFRLDAAAYERQQGQLREERRQSERELAAERAAARAKLVDRGFALVRRTLQRAMGRGS